MDRTEAYLDVVDGDGTACDLQDGLPLSLLFVQTTESDATFGWLAGLLVVPAHSNSGKAGQRYRRVGMGKVLFWDSEAAPGSCFTIDRNFPAIRAADALIAEGYERTVTIV